MSKKAQEKSSKSSTVHSDSPNVSISIPANVDENFEIFLSYFNKDSIFQVSRISFPLKVKETDSDFEVKEYVIKKTTFRKLDLSYNKNKLNPEYEQTIKIEKGNAIIEIRGVDNGIYADYNFEKRNGKWMLITWTDSST